MRFMPARIVLLLALVFLARALVARVHSAETPLAVPLSTFPRVIDEWRGGENSELAPDVLRVLGADDYLSRMYQASDRGSAVSLYMAFYAAQRAGSTIHSPQHCLPGNGWQPISRGRMRLDTSGGPSINRYVVQKRGVRQLVLYWFQGRGRIVASEYANKIYLFADALRLGRTDGTLVRVTTPFVADERTAETRAVRFAQALEP